MIKGHTKQRIAQAAVRLFNEQGTAAVSTNHIAEAAGISPGNLYYHYRNKEEIIRAIFERMNTSWGHVVAMPQEEGTSPLTGLQRMLGETFSLLWEYRFFYREFVALMRRDPTLGQRYREVRERGLANTENLLNGFVQGGVLRDLGDPTAVNRLARIIWLIIEFWLPFAEMGEETIEPQRVHEGVELLMQCLKPYMTEEAVVEPAWDRQEPHIREDKS
jgi:AcrR family transcriptional regulator